MARLIANVTGNVTIKQVGYDKIDLATFEVYFFTKVNGKTKRITTKVELWENDVHMVPLAARDNKIVYLYGDMKTKPVYNSKRTQEVFVANKVYIK